MTCNHAIVYARVSTDGQDTLRQDRMLTEYCEREQLEIITRLEDPDTSGSVPFAEREGGAELLAILDTANAERLRFGPIRDDDPPLFHIVTTEHDRVGRDLIDTVGTIRRFWQGHALPHFTAEGGTFARSPVNELILGTRASTAQFERDLIRQRIRSKMKGKRQAGELCGTIPFGWDAVATGEQTAKGVAVRKLVANLPEQEWLFTMARLRQEGRSYHFIARHLNQAGVRPKRAGQLINGRVASDQWQPGNVAHVLQNTYTRKLLEGAG
jgi:putative DNA-invertase from lambdoid prophage Rac